MSIIFKDINYLLSHFSPIPDDIEFTTLWCRMTTGKVEQLTVRKLLAWNFYSVTKR